MMLYFGFSYTILPASDARRSTSEKVSYIIVSATSVVPSDLGTCSFDDALPTGNPFYIIGTLVLLLLLFREAETLAGSD